MSGATWLSRLLGRRPSAARAPWQPTHRHKKGGLYRVTGTGIYEADRSPVTIYDDAQGTVWVRATAEFTDGRFMALPENCDIPTS